MILLLWRIQLLAIWEIQAVSSWCIRKINTSASLLSNNLKEHCGMIPTRKLEESVRPEQPVHNFLLIITYGHATRCFDEIWPDSNGRRSQLAHFHSNWKRNFCQWYYVNLNVTVKQTRQAKRHGHGYTLATWRGRENDLFSMTACWSKFDAIHQNICWRPI